MTRGAKKGQEEKDPNRSSVYACSDRPGTRSPHKSEMACTAVACPWHGGARKRGVYKPARAGKGAWPLRYNRNGAACPWCERTKCGYWRLNKQSNVYYCNSCYTRHNKYGQYPRRCKEKWHTLRDRFRPAEDEWAAGLVNENGTMKADTQDPPSSEPQSGSEEDEETLRLVVGFMRAHAEELEPAVDVDSQGGCHIFIVACWWVVLAPILGVSREALRRVMSKRGKTMMRLQMPGEGDDDNDDDEKE